MLGKSFTASLAIQGRAALDLARGYLFIYFTVVHRVNDSVILSLIKLISSQYLSFKLQMLLTRDKECEGHGAHGASFMHCTLHFLGWITCCCGCMSHSTHCSDNFILLIMQTFLVSGFVIFPRSLLFLIIVSSLWSCHISMSWFLLSVI